jgi:hypothetical protein
MMVRIVLILIAAALMTGCRKAVALGGGYRISAPASPDGAHHGNTLEFNGVRVCDNVAMQQLHEDLIVFSGYIEEGPLDGEQLFVLKGSGPRVLLSQWVVQHPMAVDDPISGKPASLVQIEELTPTADGVRARFLVGVSHKGKRLYETHDLSWSQLESLNAQGQNGQLEKCPSGDYRVLTAAAR